MQAGTLADRVRELEETEKGMERMCKEMEQLYDEGKAEGQLEKAKNTAVNLARLGMSAEEIALAVEENMQLVRDWLLGSVSAVR